MMWLQSRLLIENTLHFTAQTRQATRAGCRPLPVPSEPTVLAIAGTSCRAQGGQTAVAGGHKNSSGVFSRKLSARSLLLLSLWSFRVQLISDPENSILLQKSQWS